ncbi:MAG: CARDB domain-containing protein [Candidatus Methanomethylicia archaeon]
MVRIKKRIITLSYLVLLMVLFVSVLAPSILQVYASPPPTWPTSWIQIDWDKNENGPQDDWRDVEYAYYNFDSSYLYLRLKCYDVPGKNWPQGDARYKWFIDLDGNLHVSGGNVIEAEYLLFVEDTDNDGNGELYLLFDQNNNGDFEEYEPKNYLNYKIIDANIGGWRIISQYIDMYISWSSLGNPSSYGLFWATDQENPNLNQAPTTDTRDEETVIIVHDVAAISQSVNATEVKQGDTVEITVVVKNLGMQSESFDVTCYFYPTIIGTQHVTSLSVGGSVTLTFYWNTYGVEPGIYNIMAFTDSAGEILEINEENNWCTAEATVKVKVHDVAAISQSVNATEVKQGDTVEITVVVKNLGDFTETFNVACYYDDTSIGQPQTVENLNSGEERNLKFYWDTSSVQPGVYFIKAFADSSKDITEYNEENNNCTMITPVTVVAQPGILDVDKVLVSGPLPAVVGREAVYEILIVVSNVGGSEIVKVNVTDTISEGIILDLKPSQGSAGRENTNGIVWNVGDLDVGESANLIFTIQFTPSVSGVYTLNYGKNLEAKGISNGQEVSDRGDRDVMINAVKRDLAAVSQTPLKDIVVQGELVGIDVVVENLGDFTETFNVACYYNNKPIQPISIIRVLNLESGGSETIRFIWNTTGVPPGTYCIKAFADSGREIDESDENNNNCTSTTCVKIVIHDIVAVSQTPHPEKVVQGETVTIKVEVRNDGTETESFKVRCYYYGVLECCQGIKVIDLAPGESRVLDFVWDTANISPGIYYIEARALPVEGELDTEDNVCMSRASVIIKAPPVGGVVVSQFQLQTLTALIAVIVAAIIVGMVAFRKFKVRRIP